MAGVIRRFDTRRQTAAEILSAVRRPPLADMEPPARAAAALERLFGPGTTPLEAVRRIVESVRQEGDRAVVRWTRELDGVSLSPGELWIGPERLAGAASDPALASLLPALRAAAGAIERFHRRQLPSPIFEMTAPGVAVGWLPQPVRRAAVYVPGGTAPLLSTVLMGALPARIAGVGEIVVATPPPVHPGVLVAAYVAGASRVLQVGGAQAIAALAYGTESIPPVDVIAGPGNLFVQLAKREVAGVVGIDSLAGPTEVVVLADGSARPEWVAADLVAQAEHAPDAAAILITDSLPLAEAVERALQRELESLPRGETARLAISRWGAVVLCRSLDPEGLELADAIAPEHLEIATADPMALAARVRCAGAVFVGLHAPEALGDYAAGSNHILPTNGTARFASAVSVHTFLRATTLVYASPSGLHHLGPVVEKLAEAEGLAAHARSVSLRRGALPEGET